MTYAWMTAAARFSPVPRAFPSALPADGEAPDPTDAPTDAAEIAADAVDATVDLLQLVLGAAIGFTLGVIAMLLVQAFVRHLLRRTAVVLNALRPTARPLRLALGAVGAWLGMSYMLRSARPDWYGTAWHATIIVEILALTWFASALVGGAEGAILESLRQAGQSRYRKVQTQMQILQRVISVAIWLFGFAAVLLTFPSARTVGASLLASAGVVSVIAGIAAQSTFGNVFAGLQLAFSDSIRVGDVINWEGTRCNVEEITLTYVVLRVWDGRRLIVPSSKMTTQTFENWTRRSSELLDHVDFRLDWSAPIPEIRAELAKLLAATDLWDGRVGVLQVRDTDGETIQVSALVSARNSSTMTDLRNYIREEMVVWLQREYPDALPHTRYFNYNWEEPGRPGGRSAAASRGDARRARGGGEASAASAGVPAEGGGARASGLLAVDGAEAGLADPNAPARVPIAERFVENAHMAGAATVGHASSVFSGSIEAEARAREFESAGAAAAAEREEAARRKRETRKAAEVEADGEHSGREGARGERREHGAAGLAGKDGRR